MGSSLDRFLADPPKKATPQPQQEERSASLDDFLSSDRKAEGRIGAASRHGSADRDKSTRVLQLQSKTGLAPDLIERNIDTVSDNVFRDVTAGASSSGPTVRDWLSENPHHVAAATPDLSRLNYLERQFKYISSQFKVSGIQQQVRNLVRKDFNGTITPQERSQLDSLESVIGQEPTAEEFGLEGFFETAIGKTAGQAGVLASTAVAGLKGASAGAAGGAMIGAASGPGAIVTAAGGAALGAAIGVYSDAADQMAMEAFREFSKLTDENGRPLSRTNAKGAAIGVGLLGGALEAWSLGKTADLVPGVRELKRTLSKSAIKRALQTRTAREALGNVAKGVAVATATEAGTEGMQTALQSVAGNIELMLQDGSASRIGTVEALNRIFSEDEVAQWGEAAVTGAQVGMVLSGAGGAVSGTVDTRRALKSAAEGRRNANFFERLGGAVTDSHLSKQLPEKLEEVVERLTKDGPIETVHAPVDTWNSYWQSQNVDPAEMAETVTGSPDAYNQAVAAGHDIEIPTARYARHIAATPHNAYFVNELRLSPEQMNGRESEEFVKTLGEQEKAETPADDTSPVETAATRLSDRLTQELVATGRYDEETARTQVDALYGAPFRALASRGVPLEQLTGIFDRLSVTEGTLPSAPIATVNEAMTPIIEQGVERLAAQGLVNESGVQRFISARNASGRRRGIKSVSIGGLLAELRDYYNVKMQAAGERAQYRNVRIEGGNEAEIYVPMATRKTAGASEQAKALQNLEDYRRITAEIEAELVERGVPIEQIREAMTLDEEQFAERFGGGVIDDETLIDPETGRELFQSAYHGSPHIFDRFSLQKIGTGEGAQSYGWGLYFAGKKAVAQFYRDKLAPSVSVSLDGGAPKDIAAVIRDQNLNQEERYVLNALVNDSEIVNGKVREALEKRVLWYESLISNGWGDESIFGPRRDAARSLASRVTDARGGKLYTVEIPEDDTMLLWNRPLGDHEGAARIAIEAARAEMGDDFIDEIEEYRNEDFNQWTGKILYQALSKYASESPLPGVADVVDSEEEAASRYLASVGMAGLKYPDQGSRGQGDEKSYNYVIFDDKLIEIRDYEQENRGRISFSESGINISLLEKADLSTFIHETGHFYTEVLTELAKTNESVATDLKVLREWAGATEGESLTREQHETIARGFEAYLMEGKAPSVELRGAFSRMKAWMLLVYKSLVSLNVNLTPEVRGVFDRLVATDEEIQRAEESLPPLFADPASIGMSEQQAERYGNALREAHESAKPRLEQKALAEVKREQTRQWKLRREKVRAEVAEEVNNDPAWRALSILQRGTLPDGTELPEGTEPIKLDRQAIVAMYGGNKEVLKTLPRPYVYAKEGGIHPGVAAELFGFDSGDALIKALPTNRTAKAHIESLTDERMRQQYGDILTDGRLAEEALKAVHGKDRSQVLQMELKHLASENLASLKGLVRKVSGRIPVSETVRREAQRIIAQKRNRDIKPNIYLVAERRHAKNATEALLKGDVQLAFDEKLKEQFNSELYAAAQEAREEANRAARYLSRFSKKEVRARVGKAGGTYLDQIDALMERFDFRVSVTNKALDKRQRLAAFAKEHGDVDIPDYLLDEANRKHYAEMTLEELRGLRDTIKQIDHLARFKNQLLANKRRRDLEEAASEVVASIVANSRGAKPKEIEARLPQESKLRAFGSWFAGHRKYASLVRQMDGFEDGAASWEHLVRPLNEAGAEEAARTGQATVALHEIFNAYSARDTRLMYQKMVVPGTNLSISKMGRIMVALNWGNETNRQRIMDGYGWNEDQAQRILDTLDERDWRFVQSVWDHIDSYWPELQALGKDLHGIAPPKVEAAPFATRFGEIKGGYFPIMYDDRQSHMAFEHNAEAIADRIKKGAIVKASTQKGMLQSRVEGTVQAEVRLDFNVIFEHVNTVIHTITHTRVLQGIDKILAHEDVRASIYEHYGDVVYKQLTKTVQDVAAGNLASQNAFENGMSWVRHGATIVGLGWSPVTSMLQPFGLSNSVARIGGKWVVRGVTRWLGGYRHMSQTVEWVHGQSDFMRTRHKTMQREINEIRNQVGLDGGKLTGWVDEALETVTRDKVTREGIADSFFYMIGKMQMVADIPTWLGAYEKSMAEGNDESKSVALADQAVLDSQGGGQIKDLSSVQRGGPLLKLWTNFYSYFNVVYNQLAEAGAKTNFRHPAEIGRLGADFLMVIAVPSALAVVVRDLAKGKGDDDDFLTGLPFRWLKEMTSSLAGTMLGIRELTGAIQGYYGYTGPAGSRLFSDAANLIRQASQGEADAAFWKALNRTSGILFHYPAAQVERTVRGIAAMKSGDTTNPAALLFGPEKR